MSASCVVLVFCLSGASLHKDDANKRTKKIRKCSVSQNREPSYPQRAYGIFCLYNSTFTILTCNVLMLYPFYCIFLNKTPTFPVPKHPKSCYNKILGNIQKYMN